MTAYGSGVARIYPSTGNTTDPAALLLVDVVLGFASRSDALAFAAFMGTAVGRQPTNATTPLDASGNAYSIANLASVKLAAATAVLPPNVVVKVSVAFPTLAVSQFADTTFNSQFRSDFVSKLQSLAPSGAPAFTSVAASSVTIGGAVTFNGTGGAAAAALFAASFAAGFSLGQYGPTAVIPVPSLWPAFTSVGAFYDAVAGQVVYAAVQPGQVSVTVAVFESEVCFAKRDVAGDSTNSPREKVLFV